MGNMGNIDYTKEITRTEIAVQSLSQSDMDNRSAWLAERRKGIGGSDAAAILRVSPWKSYAALWAEKTGVWKERDISRSSSVRFGVENEDKVAQIFSEKTGLQVYQTGHFHRIDAPWMQASPDRLIFGEAAGLECKTTSSAYAYEWGEGDIPDAYFCQIQWYMMVMGFPVWYIACLFRDTGRFICRRIERNDAFIAFMEKEASRFWGLVSTGTFPPNDGSLDYAKLLQEEFGCEAGSAKPLDKSAVKLCETILSIEDEIGKLKIRRQEAMNKLAIKMKNAETGYAGRFLVKWKPNARGQYKVLTVSRQDFEQQELFH